MINKLIGALIGLARATEGNEHLITESTSRVMLKALSSTITCNPSNTEQIAALLQLVDEEKYKLVPKCYTCPSSCGRNNDYDMNLLWEEEPEIRQMKIGILLMIQSLAVHASHIFPEGVKEDRINYYFYKALYSIGAKDWSVEYLQQVSLEGAEIFRIIIE